MLASTAGCIGRPNYSSFEVHVCQTTATLIDLKSRKVGYPKIPALSLVSTGDLDARKPQRVLQRLRQVRRLIWLYRNQRHRFSAHTRVKVVPVRELNEAMSYLRRPGAKVWFLVEVGAHAKQVSAQYLNATQWSMRCSGV